ncbi:ATP-binding protein, partial [Arthrospira platensis SPKY2]
TASKLFSRLKLCKVDGTYLKELNKLTNKDLLIIDDFGLQAFDNFTRETLLEIIDERLNTGSVIIASQIPVSVWHEIIGESTIADAILDRLIHSSHRIDLKGDSMRKGMLDQE